MSGGLFTNQLLRETAVEIDPERVERLQRAHARAYQQYSVQIPLPGARKLLVNRRSNLALTQFWCSCVYSAPISLA
jgi:hypothetical protein